MERKAKKRKPDAEPARRIELPARHTGLRAAAAVVFVAIAAVAFAFAVHRLVTKSPGITKIEPRPGTGESCCAEFDFQYELGRSGESPTPEYKRLAGRFAVINAEACRLFSADKSFGDCRNLYYLNSHPNEEVTVEQSLYKAFELFEKYQNESLYLAPVYEQYRALYACNYDYEAADFDPLCSAEARAYIDRLLSFAQNRDMVSLELLGGRRVRLNVAKAYSDFAEAEGLETYIDFFWLKNAFVADYMAEKLSAEGFTHGILSSCDGFVRHLGDIAVPLRCNIFDRVGKSKYAAARMEHKNSVNIVHFRNYMRSELDTLHYYEWENGRTDTPYIDIRDGLSKGPVSELTAYSREYGCAELALLVYDVYVADGLDRSLLSDRVKKGADFVWCADGRLYFTDPDADFSDLYEDEKISYKTELVS